MDSAINQAVVSEKQLKYNSIGKISHKNKEIEIFKSNYNDEFISIIRKNDKETNRIKTTSEKSLIHEINRQFKNIDINNAIEKLKYEISKQREKDNKKEVNDGQRDDNKK